MPCYSGHAQGKRHTPLPQHGRGGGKTFCASPNPWESNTRKVCEVYKGMVKNQLSTQGLRAVGDANNRSESVNFVALLIAHVATASLDIIAAARLSGSTSVVRKAT